jgi:hypothetical protein
MIFQFKPRNHTGWLSLLSLLLLFPLPSFAIDLSDSLTINGFYNLSASLSDNADVSLPSGSSTAHTIEQDDLYFDDSLIGIQLDYAVTDNLSLTLQAISSRLIDDNYSPSVEWAYLSYDFAQDTTIRLGKLQLPFLQGTELRYVGFSRLWVRPLVPTNGTGGFDSFNGAEIIKGISIGDYIVKFHGAYGIADHRRDFIENDDVKLISTQIEKTDFKLSLALLQARYDAYNLQHTRLFQANSILNMASLEAEKRLESYIINLGYAYGDSEFLPEDEVSYLSLGYQMDRWTPYILLQSQKVSYIPSPPPPPGAPPPPNPAKDGERTTDSISVGFRYDLSSHYSLKAQIASEKTHDHSALSQPAIDNDTNIYTIVFEGVF